MKAIYALYSTPLSAQRAVDHLHAAGISDSQIAVQSSEPLEEYEFAHRDHETRMTWIAAGGGLLGLLSGYFMTAVTQKLWEIDTGGMPIVTNWSNLIVIFELTMLGAIFAAVITLLITAKLPSRRPVLYDPMISNGKILIGVTDVHGGAAGDVERALRAGGAKDVKTIS